MQDKDEIEKDKTQNVQIHAKIRNDQQANGMTYEYVDKKNNIYNNLNQGINIKTKTWRTSTSNNKIL